MKNRENNKMIIILLVVCIGWILGIVLNILCDNHLLYYPSSHKYPDYIATIMVTDNLYSGISIGRGYFPFTYVILKIIKIFFDFNLIGYFSTFILFLAILFSFALFMLKQKNNIKSVIQTILFVCFLLCFSYPIFFEFDRANIEYIVVSFLLLFFILYKKEKYKLAAILLSFAICMKLYPALFIIIFLKNKKYKEFLLCGIFSILLMFFSYIIVGGNIVNLSIALENFSFFTNMFAKNGHGLPYNHTLWTFFNVLNINSGILTINQFAEKFISIYTIIILLIASLISIYLIFIEKEEWKIITILTIMMITFPHVSFDYTLIHMYIPITYFITSKNTKKWEEITYSILFGLSIIPMNWFQTIINGYITLNIGLILRPLILISIIITIVISTIKNKVLNKTEIKEISNEN